MDHIPTNELKRSKSRSTRHDRIGSNSSQRTTPLRGNHSRKKSSINVTTTTHNASALGISHNVTTENLRTSFEEKLFSNQPI